jgi:hypothetical protein
MAAARAASRPGRNAACIPSTTRSSAALLPRNDSLSFAQNARVVRVCEAQRLVTFSRAYGCKVRRRETDRGQTLDGAGRLGGEGDGDC